MKYYIDVLSALPFVSMVIFLFWCIKICLGLHSFLQGHKEDGPVWYTRVIFTTFVLIGSIILELTIIYQKAEFFSGLVDDKKGAAGVLLVALIVTILISLVSVFGAKAIDKDFEYPFCQ